MYGAIMLDLTVVVCGYNVEKTIKACLRSIKKNSPQKIIYIDGNSSDHSKQIAAGYADLILDDGAKGLANARNMGIDKAETEYIAFAGPDNVMPEGSLKAMIKYLEDYDCAIVSARTFMLEQSNYIGWAQNIYRKRKYTPGYKDTVGTPVLYKRSVIKKYKYDEFMKNCDDTELCSRMAEDDMLFAISEAFCYETGFDNLHSIIERWTRYGRGDYLFYLKKKDKWNNLRKMQSVVHPIVHDFILPMKRVRPNEYAVIPFLIIIVILRYYGWLKSLMLHVERRESFYSKDK